MAYRGRSNGHCRPQGFPFRFLCAALMSVGGLAATPAGQDFPIGALWVAPAAVTSPPAIRRTVLSARADGFDTVLVPVTLGARDRSALFEGEGEMVRHAREAGLRVYLAIGVSVAAGVGELPPAREHVIYQHPEWLMVPRELAPELLKLDARSPAYLGRLARWTRANADRVSGLYISPLAPGAASYLVGAVIEAVRRHSTDGVYLDAISFPGADFDYSRQAMELFRASIRPQLSPADRIRLDEVEAIDPFGYAEQFPDEWRKFREASLTNLLKRLRAALDALDSPVPVAVGAAADPDRALDTHFQTLRTWLDGHLAERIGHRSADSVLFSADGSAPFRPARLSIRQDITPSGAR